MLLTPVFIYIVSLDDFSALRKSTYGGHPSTQILQFASKQLDALSSVSDIAEIRFDMVLDEYKIGGKKCLYRSIDNDLSTDKFPFLRRVELDMELPSTSSFFPHLQKRGLLEPLRNSNWI